jgi:adenylate cyclase
MIVFGLPEPRQDDAIRAIDCGRVLADRPRIRVSIHYGRVVAGVTGGANHAQVTVNGDTVNVASRLQDAAKEHGVSLILSREVIAAAGAPVGFQRLGNVALRGRSEPVEVWAADS